MNIKKSFILFVSASAFAATASVALASSYNAKLGDAPFCPKPSLLPLITDVSGAGAGAGTGWTGYEYKAIDSDWPLGVYEPFYTQDPIHKNTALVRAKEIEKSANTVVEWKVPWGDGSYFWTCDYGIDHTYVSNHDSLNVFSKDYDSNGQLSHTQLSNAKKLSLFNNEPKTRVHN